MLSRYHRFSAASSIISNLRSSNSLARVASQLAAFPTATSDSIPSLRRHLGSSCCPPTAPSPATPSSADLGPVPSFLMSRAIRYSQVKNTTATLAHQSSTLLSSYPICHINTRSQFSPKLYNWSLSLGFTRGKTIPSVAFCSDESQGYPSLVITKVWCVAAPAPRSPSECGHMSH